MKTIESTNGPSREEMFDGLRLASEKRLIPFIIMNNDVERWIAVIITSIQSEDGSGQSWNLNFSIGKKFVSESFFLNHPKKNEEYVVAKKVNFDYFKQIVEENYLVGDFRQDLIIVKAQYSTKTRKGVMNIVQ